MDDANIPSLLSLPYLGFLEKNDTIYQNTRRFVLSEANPYFFKGPYGSGVGGPHILTSQSDEEILDALKIIVENTDGTGLMHEAFNVFDNTDYTRPWFAWSNTLLGEAILEIAKERPYLIFEKKLAP
ncbi:Six-hairpin glycosidase-like protein [Jimgerdemannia flammicorona]|uniref:Six-hairpin glycosidase-like protein n=1 Tax=Jimgerdemannia flammicorona TaxID=994334 RepID=A0A433QHL4_9FUNG|nr:Six-hairpin glycosidase-like protein [Jimgerdemannia flammicorona]